MHKIASIITDKAYCPEIYAYRDFFIRKYNIHFEIVFSNNLTDLFNFSADAYIIKMGLDPFWLKNNQKKSIIVHDYASCSTGKFPIVKNYIKAKLNRKSDIDLFLNNKVRQEFKYLTSSTSFIRDMGVDNFFFYNGEYKDPLLCVYSGMIRNTRIFHSLMEGFVNSNLKLIVVGQPDDIVWSHYKTMNNIEFIGKQSRQVTAEVQKRATYGINLTENLYPYSFQTSTKLLEYCASGLKIVSTYTPWVYTFMRNRGAKFNITDDFSENNIKSYYYTTPDVYDLVWDKVLSDSKFPETLVNLLGEGFE